MSKGMKSFITIVVVALAVVITACAAFASSDGQKTDNMKAQVNGELGPLAKALPIDTQYVPLPDINSEKVVERKIFDNQVIINGIISSHTHGYAGVLEQNPDAVLFVDENGNYFAVAGIERNDGYSDISITKYDSNGNELKKRTYGGSDFDWANAVKYNSQMGIVLSGISQSRDGDFANDDNTPFVACINPETLEVRWATSVQIADWVYAVSDEAIYIIRNEGKKYSGKGELKLSIVKLDRDGNKIWATEPLSQWICGITELKDGRVISIQKLSDSQAVDKSGAINCYNKDGKKLSTFEADCYGDIVATNDGGFIIVSVRNIKTVPQPLYLSSIWYDTETVVTKYDKNYKIEWRKTYDRIKDDKGADRVLPLSDGSIAL